LIKKVRKFFLRLYKNGGSGLCRTECKSNDLITKKWKYEKLIPKPIIAFQIWKSRKMKENEASKTNKEMM